MRKNLFGMLSFLFIVCGFQIVAAGQSTTGHIVGTVKNSSGEVVPGAEILIVHTQTNKQVTAMTDGEGRYHSAPLAVGEYQVEARMQGFRRSVNSGIKLQLQQTVVVDFALEVGTVSEQVMVTAQAPALDTTSSTVGQVVDNRSILELPLNTRNVYSLIFLTPGISGTIGNDYGELRFSINGARARTSDILIDGVTATFPTVNGDVGISAFPSVDAIQEFKVLGANSPAEFGRTLGGIVNVVYKSGTNAFHGSAYEFLRNSVLDANNFFSNLRHEPLGSFKRSQFGANLEGPIRRDKTFFMGSFEGLRERGFRTTTFTVPTDLQRQGDFSKTFNQSNQLIRIYNPFTTRANPNFNPALPISATNSRFIRDPFTDNKIPSSLFDPVALNILKYYPRANQPGDSITAANNYSASGSAAINLNNYDVRIDHRFTDKQNMFGRYSQRSTEDAPLQAFPEDLTIAEGRVILENHVRNFVAEHTYTFSPSMIMTSRIGFARTLFVFSNQGLGFKPSSLGLPTTIDAAVDREMFPRINASGIVSLGGNDHRYNAFMSYPLVVNLTQIKNSHSVKYGFEGRLIRVNVWEARDAGSFSFTAGATQGPDPTRASSSVGNGFASLLLGTGSSGNLIQAWKNVASQSFYLAGYIQDDWRVNSKLTLNLGLRYDFETPRTERYDRINYYDPTAPSPLAQKVPAFPSLKGGVVFVGVNGTSRYQYDKDANNFAPRLGLAYQIDSKTVVRAGYSHIFGPSPQAAQGTVGPFGFRIENPWVTSLDGITPFNLLRNPYPDGFREPPGSSEGLLTQVGANLQAPLRNTVVPWSQQWVLNIQRELPGDVTLEVGYVGNRGLQLSRGGEGGFSLNQLDPKYMALGSTLNDLVPNPFYGIVTTGVLANPQVSRAQLLRPYPQFTDIHPLFSGGASSFYHALQISFSKRLSRGLQFEGSYVWSKTMDEGTNHQDSYDIRSSRALSSIDIAHRFIIGYLYELPFGHGRKYGTNSNSFVNAVIGGWQLNGITAFQGGTPLTLSATNSSGTFSQTIRANNNGKSGKLEGPVQERLNKYFDTTVYSQPAPFTFGTAGATLPDIRSDGVRNFDISLFKMFDATERLKIQFRIEALNAFNTPRFSGPNTSVTSSSFGVITSQANAPRQMQFGLKLLW